MWAIQIDDLSFCYPNSDKPVLSHIHLRVEEGQRFGLFGPNGAGKTTLIGLMTGLLKSAEGTIRLMGQEPGAKNKNARLFGFVPQDFSFYPELSLMENLRFFGIWQGVKPGRINSRASELIQLLGLEDSAHKQLKHYSGGMKRRANLAIGVIHDPKILFLDEPTVGVDVQSRMAIVSFLKQLNESGTTLIYTSHMLHEAEDLCRDIALIKDGALVAAGGISDLLGRYQVNNLEQLYLNLTGTDLRNDG